jgi:hypothetical protein
MLALLFLRRLLRNEGMATLAWIREREGDYGLIDEVGGARDGTRNTAIVRTCSSEMPQCSVPREKRLKLAPVGRCDANEQ